MTHENVVSMSLAGACKARAGCPFARGIVLAALERIQIGRLTLLDDGQKRVFGRSAESEGDAPDVLLVIRDERAWWRIAFGGHVGAGEAFVQGWWTTSDLTALVRLLIVNGDSLGKLDGGWGRLLAPFRRLFHWRRDNTRAGSRANIAAHYDLGNDFYRTFLDESLTYSSGIFATPETTLHEAQIAKLDRICRKLRLTAADHVVEIGTGWGSFALHAAAQYGCRVTTTTISRQQYDLARERIAAAGLSGRVTLLLEDYRDLRGQFDKLVSIEMIEAVGWRYYDAYFAQCGRLLKPDGQACIQAITVAERYYERAKREVDFIKRYVFPGSCIPSTRALLAAAGRASDMTLTHAEDFGPHYATTLRKWHEAVASRGQQIRGLGLPDSFLRLWAFYLCYCEAGFLERTISVAQLVWNKPGCRATPVLGTIQDENPDRRSSPS